MNLGTQEQRTEGMKKRAQELIDQAYQRGYKAGQNSNVEQYNKAWGEQAKDYIEIGRKIGHNEAWEAVRKLLNTPIKTALDMLADGDENLTMQNLFNKYSASETIEKIREHDERKKDKIEYIANFCNGRLCSNCVLRTSDYQCGCGHHWTTDPDECGDIDKAYNLVKEYEKKKQDDEIRVGDEVLFDFDENHKEEKGVVWAIEEGHVYVFGRYCMDGDSDEVTKTGRYFPEIAEVLAKMKEGN